MLDFRSGRAHFVTSSTIAWPWPTAPELEYRLHHGPDGGLRVADGAVRAAGVESATLARSGLLPERLTDRDGWRQLSGRPAFARPGRARPRPLADRSARRVGDR